MEILIMILLSGVFQKEEFPNATNARNTHKVATKMKDFISMEKGKLLEF
jgi:hypothetical protein